MTETNDKLRPDDPPLVTTERAFKILGLRRAQNLLDLAASDPEAPQPIKFGGKTSPNYWYLPTLHEYLARKSMLRATDAAVAPPVARPSPPRRAETPRAIKARAAASKPSSSTSQRS